MFVEKNFIIIWRNLFERGKAFESVLFWYLDCFRACLPAKSFFKRQILKQQKSREKKNSTQNFFSLTLECYETFKAPFFTNAQDFLMRLGFFK